MFLFRRAYRRGQRRPRESSRGGPENRLTIVVKGAAANCVVGTTRMKEAPVTGMETHQPSSVETANAQTPVNPLEAEAVYILRETAAEFRRPALLYSAGKDSSALLRLAQKA